MIGTATGLLALVAGIFLMRVLPHIKSTKVQWLIERAAMILVVTGGILGLSGWVGDWVDSLTQWTVDQANRLGVLLFGQDAAAVGGLVGLLGYGLAIWWILAFLPNRWADNDAPDWLIYAGFFIPSLLAAANGPLAQLLSSIFAALGSGGVSGLGG